MNGRSNFALRVIAYLGASSLSAACNNAEYGGVRITQETSPPLAVDISDERITLSVGAAVALKVLPESRTDQAYTANDALELRSDRTVIFEAYPTRDRDNRIIVTGKRAGSSCLQVIVARTQVDCIPVIVRAQTTTDDEL